MDPTARRRRPRLAKGPHARLGSRAWFRFHHRRWCRVLGHVVEIHELILAGAEPSSIDSITSAIVPALCPDLSGSMWGMARGNCSMRCGSCRHRSPLRNRLRARTPDRCRADGSGGKVDPRACGGGAGASSRHDGSQCWRRWIPLPSSATLRTSSRGAIDPAFAGTSPHSVPAPSIHRLNPLPRRQDSAAISQSPSLSTGRRRFS
jgi:hypothetical protein